MPIVSQQEDCEESVVGSQVMTYPGVGIREQGGASVDCLGELLTSIISPKETRPCIELGDCCFDPVTGIETGSRLSIKVDCEERRASTGNRTITMSGTVDNHQGQVKPFTLYLSLWHQEGGPGWMAGSSCCCSWSRRLDIPCAGRERKQLFDTLFDVEVYRRLLSGRLVSGRGRGFLFFQNRLCLSDRSRSSYGKIEAGL